MIPPTMWAAIFQILVIPAAAAAILTIIRIVADPATSMGEFDRHRTSDIGTDLAVLGAGACGAVFSDAAVQRELQGNTAYVGVLMAFGCVIVALVVLLIGKRQKFQTLTEAQAIRNIGIGAIGILIPAIVIGVCYVLSPNSPPPQPGPTPLAQRIISPQRGA